jgi:hypothetical protein
MGVSSRVIFCFNYTTASSNTSIAFELTFSDGVSYSDARPRRRKKLAVRKALAADFGHWTDIGLRTLDLIPALDLGLIPVEFIEGQWYDVGRVGRKKLLENQE